MQVEIVLCPLLSSGRAAELIGNHPKTLEKWRSRGIGPRFLRVGGRVRYRQADIEQFLNEAVIDPAAAATARNRARRRNRAN